MDIANLKRIIKANIIDQPSGRKTLTVTGELLESNTLTNLFTDYLERQPLVIEMTEPLAETANSIIVSGSSPNEIFSQMLVSAQFSAIANEAALVLTAQPNTQWTFASSFPALAKTFFSRLEFGEDTALHLASYAVNSNTPIGLSFAGTLQLNGMIGYIAWILGGEREIGISGPIRLEFGKPAIQLATQPTPKKIGIGFFELPAAKLELVSCVTPEKDAQPVMLTAFASISSAINVESENGTVSIPLRADSHLTSSWIRLSADLDKALESSFENLSNLVNGANLSHVLPSQLPVQDQIGLKELALQLNVDSRTLESVNILVESKQPWTLIQDAITLEKLMLNFRLDNPMTTKQLSMMMKGEFGIGDNSS